MVHTTENNRQRIVDTFLKNLVLIAIASKDLDSAFDGIGRMMLELIKEYSEQEVIEALEPYVDIRQVGMELNNE